MCGCCGAVRRPEALGEGVSRREFLASVGVVTAGGLALSALAAPAASAVAGGEHRLPKRLPLKMQPVLLYYLSGKPVFLNDPTYPYRRVVTIAHCTAPRKMDGQTAEPVRLLTHSESDYGAAPKVEMKIGQVVTNLIPDFASRNGVGFEGVVLANPFLDICRSQVDIQIHGDQDRLLREMKGFHWMTRHGNYLRETGYALRKVGVDWIDLSSAKAT
jgi:hypothetical protein